MVPKNLISSLLLILIIFSVTFPLSLACKRDSDPNIDQCCDYSGCSGCGIGANPLLHSMAGGVLAAKYTCTSVKSWYGYGTYDYNCYSNSNVYLEIKHADNGHGCACYEGLECGVAYSGKVDASEYKCVICSGKKESEKITASSLGCDTTNGDGQCESACGASSECDEVNPGTKWYDTGLDTCKYCGSDCTYASYDCDDYDIKTSGSTYIVDYEVSSSSCTVGCSGSGCCYKAEEGTCSSSSHTNCQKKTIEGTTLYCTWMAGTGWAWRTADDLPSEICDDGIDNDCDGKKDCADTEDCAGKQGPNGVTCCQNDNDCSSLACGNYASYCDNSGTNPTYTCKCYKECETNNQCADGYCCKYVVTGKNEDKVCVEKGTIIDKDGKSYICDPPVFEEASNKFSSFDLIFSFNPFS